LARAAGRVAAVHGALGLPSVKGATGGLLDALGPEAAAAAQRVAHLEVSWSLFLVPVVVIVLLEHLIPARRGHRLLTVTPAQDLVWLSVEMAVRATWYH